jgi:tRNA wybutosine-synthesizing protein 4
MLNNVSDPLPWQCLTRYPSASNDVKFIDIDYKDLMLKKKAVVESTSQLNSMLTNVKLSDGNVLLQSDQYVQLGCDLGDLGSLQKTLASAVDVENSVILFAAEVSITYMDVSAADALIKWCGSLPDGTEPS